MLYPVNCTGLYRYFIHANIYTLGYNEFYFFLENKETQTLWWVQNWNLRHIYKIRFLIFWAVSCAFSFKVWKSTKMTLKKFFLQKIEKGVKKRRISRWFRIRWKSCEKMHKKKVISKTSLTNMSKSEKSAFFRPVFAKNLFWVLFFKTFSTDSKSAWNSAFFDTFSDFFKKYFFLGHICTFSNFDCKCAGNGSKKRKIFFYECILEFNYATIKGFA